MYSERLYERTTVMKGVDITKDGPLSTEWRHHLLTCVSALGNDEEARRLKDQLLCLF